MISNLFDIGQRPSEVMSSVCKMLNTAGCHGETLPLGQGSMIVARLPCTNHYTREQEEQLTFWSQLEFWGLMKESSCFYRARGPWPANQHYALFTLADPTPKLASSVAGGNLGQSHLMSRRDRLIHIGRMVYHAYMIRAAWYGKGSSLVYYNSLWKTVALYT